ncbi:MAG: hypothetical protein JO257_22995 [Deltaproteobacteria bacterium]|nr:hypothetical protein [Deltaproteobacteria bacterium]
MTTKQTLICAVATLLCAGTALKAALALVHRESYVVSWWDASIAGTGRTLTGLRIVIKLVSMLAVAVACGLALAQVIAPVKVFTVVIPVVVISALSELTAPKPKRGR